MEYNNTATPVTVGTFVVTVGMCVVVLIARVYAWSTVSSPIHMDTSTYIDSLHTCTHVHDFTCMYVCT